MRRKFAKFSVCSLLFLASSFSAAAYEPPFSRTESVAIESPNALFLRWEKTDGDADSRREPRLTGKQQRDGATVFRFRFRQPGRYRLFFKFRIMIPPKRLPSNGNSPSAFLLPKIFRRLKTRLMKFPTEYRTKLYHDDYGNCFRQEEVFTDFASSRRRGADD